MWQTACEMMKLCRNLFILIVAEEVSNFITESSEEVSEFIGMCAKKWNAQNENTLHCMFATNQLVAEYSGFSKVYEVFKRAEVYRGDWI